MKFYSDIALWLLLPWLVFCLGIAFWYYRNQKQVEGIKKTVRWSLIGLRGLSLFLLGVLLYGIMLETAETKLEKPVFITLVDNSSSLLNYKDSSKVKKSIDDFERSLKSRFGERFDLVFYHVDSKVNTGKFDLSGSVSDLDAGFSHIYQQYYNRNIGGICFFSDGNYNKGNSPQYTAEKISLTPIFTVGVGDTVKKRDQLIRNVAVNDIAFFKNQFPIEVDIEANKMGASSAVLDLYQGKDKIASQTVKYSGEAIDFQHVTFLVDAKTIGFVNYTVRLQPVSGESSLENNARSFYVEVIDSRSKILILAQAPHPDVAAIKQVLDKDQNAEVTSQLISEWDGSLKDVELVIWHGAGATSQPALTKAVKTSGISVWYLIPSNASRGIVNELGIGLSVPSDRRSDDVQAQMQSGFQLFELSESVDEMLRKAPPIHVKYGGIQADGSSTLLSQRVGPVVKKDPILAFGKSVKSKFAIFVGEGLWRWRIAEYGRTQKHTGFEELIQKTVQYLVVKKNTDPLRVHLPKRFTTNDDVFIQAEFYNAALEAITTPDIQFELKNEQNKVIPYEFAKNAKDYKLALGKMAPGKYTWKASTSFDGKKYTKEGVFVVEDISLEALSTSSDFNVLKTISDQSNGAFFTLSQTDKLLNAIESRKDIVTVSYEETDYSDLIDWKWIALLVVLLLGSEWFLRRYFGTY